MTAVEVPDTDGRRVGEARRVDHLRLGDEIVGDLYVDDLAVRGVVVGVWAAGRMNVVLGVEDRRRGRLTVELPGEHTVIVARPGDAPPQPTDPAIPARALLIYSPAIAEQLARGLARRRRKD